MTKGKGNRNLRKARISEPRSELKARMEGMGRWLREQCGGRLPVRSLIVTRIRSSMNNDNQVNTTWRPHDYSSC